MFSVLGSSPRSRSGRSIALASAGLLAASGLSLTTTSADAALSRVGPIDPATTFPSFYTDAQGMSLQACLEGPPRCLGSQAELMAAPEGEGFYYSASATAGGIDVGLELEMAWAGIGQPIVFQRSQYAANGGGLVPNAEYTITDPYGTATCTADESGSIKNNACRTETGGGANVFSDALTGRVDPFLHWDPLSDAPPGYIGDGVTPHPIAVPPSGTNFVRVCGPAGCDQTNLFVVSGKLAPGAMGSVDRSAIAFGSVSAPVAQRVIYTSIGTAGIGVSSVTPSGPFTISENTCSGASLGSGAQCSFVVTYNPTPGVVSSGTVAVADSTGTKTINLSGKGRLGVAALSTSSVVMQDTKIGKKRNGVVTVTNAGDLDLTVSKPRFGGQNRHDFRRGLVQAGCVPGTTLAPGGACNIRVIFAPRARGVRKARLGVATSVGTQVVSLAGTGKGKDRVAPKVVGKSPSSKRVKRGKDVEVRFSEEVSGVNKRSLRLTLGSGKVVKAKLSKLEGGDLWRLDPKSKLKADKDYRVRLTGRIHDRGGNRLASTDWKFHTRG
ncbi:MAG TPA: choice-of-anchor D domain-containing protein [Nocardioides sp.]|uniref:choice-of-anchor D domain-containing protein n=1 Tax=Nocardioides sp. TaxID=35761 RepID=UPI002D7EE163|nr:choice-of-anchor D domain-containing protein [Nocardioides sp.]HET6651115.1 choice-of-anchor D domain-containing protein [Nocardioides sp.]